MVSLMTQRSDRVASRIVRGSSPMTLYAWQQVQLAVVVWAAYASLVFLFVLGVSFWRDIEISGWDVAARLVQFWAGGIGFQTGWSLMPLLVTHGWSRREFARGALALVPAFALVLAALSTATFAIEAGIYEVAGWTQAIAAERLFDSATQLHLILAEQWLGAAVWMAGGLMLALCWYRAESHPGPWYAIGPAGAWRAGSVAVAVVLAGLATTGLSAEPQPWALSEDVLPLGWGGAAIAFIVCAVVLAAVSWLAVRDIPMKNKSA